MSNENKDYLEGKIEGMTEVYEVADNAILKVRKSLENVSEIYEFMYDYSRELDSNKQQFDFASAALRRALEVFDIDYYDKIEEAKAKLENSELR